MAVRSAMPWPIRWAVVAIVLGFCAAIGLWAFEFGKGIAGLDRIAKLRDERNKAQSIINTSGSLLTAEKTTQERLTAQIKNLESDNRALRDDLGFFEKLIPAAGTEGVAIRGLQAEVLSELPTGAQMKWQVLVIQPTKNAQELNGKPWMMALPNGPVALQVKQYRRIEGVVDLPPQVVVKNVSAKVVDGTTTRAVHTIKL
jgi:hypothetical protein